ncbi:MAG: UvrB/UvrC motif-containing protein [Phycisphaerales bacterium]
MPSDRCDHCDKPAVVHELVIKNGATLEVHLCEEHAAAQGYVLPSHQPVHQLLTQFAVGGATGKSTAKQKAVKCCATCGRTMSQIRDSGRLGCADCYKTFEESLQPLIEHAQAGASFHVGRSPQGVRDAAARHELRRLLVKQLDEAVTAEQYERAAKLRDRIHHLKEEGCDGGCV